MDTHILAEVNIACMDVSYPKLKIYVSELQIHTSSTCNKAVHNLILIKITVASFMAAGSFLIRYSKGHMK
jgi:hypothetical protein